MTTGEGVPTWPRKPIFAARWVVIIRWDDEGFYTSPPIGPFGTEGDARRFETQVRKRLQANGRKWQGRVKRGRLVHPEDALTWEDLKK